MARMSYAKAIALGMAEAMEADERVFTFGEDVTRGGVYGAYQGLSERFGEERVRDTPISENAIVGAAVGAALVGQRPVAELMHMDFIACAMDQIANHAAKLPYMSRMGEGLPMVLRTPTGFGLRAGAQHAQSLESWLTHVPGLKVMTSGTAADARAVIRAAIEDDNVVVVVEALRLYDSRGDVPEEVEPLTVGKADVKRGGDDLTIVTWGASVPASLEAAEKLAESGVESEVIDLISLWPWDQDAVLDSLTRTGHLVIVHESVERSGFGAEVAAVVADQGFDLLEAPILRVAGLNVPTPFSPELEDWVMPNAERIVEAVAEFELA